MKRIILFTIMMFTIVASSQNATWFGTKTLNSSFKFNGLTLNNSVSTLMGLDVDGRPIRVDKSTVGGFIDAPINGISYLRQNASWIPYNPPNVISEAPNNGNEYVRKNGAWSQLVASSGGENLQQTLDIGNTSTTGITFNNTSTSAILNFNTGNFTPIISSQGINNNKMLLWNFGLVFRDHFTNNNALNIGANGGEGYVNVSSGLGGNIQLRGDTRNVYITNSQSGVNSKIMELQVDALRFLENGFTYQIKPDAHNLIGVFHDVRWPAYLTSDQRKAAVIGSIAPTSATDLGVLGEIRVPGDGFIYICVASNTWQRSALSTW